MNEEVDGMRHAQHPERVIFLDVDGVLAHAGTYNRGRGEERLWRFAAQLDLDCMARLIRIVRATGARIVVSSTWRRFSDQIGGLRKGLQIAGLGHDADKKVRETIQGRLIGARGRKIVGCGPADDVSSPGGIHSYSGMQG